MMTIAIIGTGNVGGALATKFSEAGHTIYLGVRNISDFKGASLLQNANTTVHDIKEAVNKAQIIVLATPAFLADQVAKSLGNTNGKIIIDAMNIIMGKGPQGFTNTTDAILNNTETRDVVKCFNTTGFNNMENPVYGGHRIDNFVAGDSHKAKEVAKKLSLDIGFETCYDIGGNDKFQLMEQFAWFWINLAMFQGQGREIAFKILKR
ncbi:NADPH-dependent F420 reductase [Gaetbulibacter aestuarii]|uniref:NAD(P)-binding domain-containing protein n=1 Tax=Gaetbulibacter aestuarii TaxID=1502358 RepID=A0ABW7N067_9FLAO